LLAEGLGSSVGCMNDFMVECYVAGLTAAEVEETGVRFVAAARELASHRITVRYVGSTFVPEEESCFFRFEAASAADVRRTCEHAGIPFARIVETHDLFPTKEDR
jgi:hypothetical protein